jgi:drug/metabolite transporter (DMT)-like permease
MCRVPRAVEGTDLGRAALHMVASALAFALMSAAVKVAARDVSSPVIVFFRNAVGLVLLVPWAVREGPRRLATQQFGGHLVRGLAGLAAMSCFFFAIGRMRLADAVLLNQSFPLFLPLAERAWLGERVRPGVWRSLGLGFLGVVVILRPGAGVWSAAALAGLASAVLAATAQVGIRRLTRTEPVARIVFYFAVIATAAAVLPLPWAWRTPTPRAWAALCAVGVLATIGQFTLTRAYAHAPAASVGPFIYAGVVFAVLIDWTVWGVLPDAWFVPGAALIAVAGVWMLRREASLTPGA